MLLDGGNHGWGTEASDSEEEILTTRSSPKSSEQSVVMTTNDRDYVDITINSQFALPYEIFSSLSFVKNAIMLYGAPKVK